GAALGACDVERIVHPVPAALRRHHAGARFVVIQSDALSADKRAQGEVLPLERRLRRGVKRGYRLRRRYRRRRDVTGVAVRQNYKPYILRGEIAAPAHLPPGITWTAALPSETAHKKYLLFYVGKTPSRCIL